MNRKGMLPFEDQIEQYVESTGNHVMYRVTPCFAGEELVARGVHMQAVSVEDNGEGLSFNVFCYNVQPGIEIDYLTGDNRIAEGDASEQANNDSQEQTSEAISENTADDRIVTVVLNTNKDRKRIHIPDTRCAKQIHEENYQEWTGTADELKKFAEENGYVPCGTCHPETKLNIDLPKRK
jgi:DNA-entry nuclease